MTPRVLASNVHVHTEDGTVILDAGSVFDEKYAEFVTNPACFVGEAEAEVDTAATKAKADAEAQAEEDAAKAKADVAQAEIDARAKEAADAKAKENADGENDGENAGTGDKGKPDEGTPEVVDYSELSYPALQKLAKSRGLENSGKLPTLIARLEADDRDKKAAAAAGN